MTREEIQIAQAAYCVSKTWDEYEGTDDFDRLVGKRVSHLIELVREFQHSISSDLDEAAKKIAYDVCKQLPNGTEKDSIVYYAILAAKAGAEWLAGQGYKQTERVYNFNGENIPCVSPVIYLPKEFEIGDKVVVQIRKK